MYIGFAAGNDYHILLDCQMNNKQMYYRFGQFILTKICTPGVCLNILELVYHHNMKQMK